MTDVASPTASMHLPLMNAPVAEPIETGMVVMGPAPIRSYPAPTGSSPLPTGSDVVTVDMNDVECCLSAALESMPYPDEPFGTTAEERSELWLIHLDQESNLIPLHEKYKSKNKRMGDIEDVLILTGFILCLAVTVTVGYGLTKSIWTPSLQMLGLASCHMVINWVFFKRSGKKATQSKLNVLSRERWYNRLNMRIIDSHITMPAPLLAVAMGTSSWKIDAGLSPADHVAMMRLTAKLKSDVDKKITKSLTLSGETDELCCRVLSAMGQDSIKAVENINSISNLKL